MKPSFPFGLNAVERLWFMLREESWISVEEVVDRLPTNTRDAVALLSFLVKYGFVDVKFAPMMKVKANPAASSPQTAANVLSRLQREEVGVLL